MMASSWFATREHQAGVWLVAAPPHVNCFLVTGRDRAVLIDTGLGIGEMHREVAALTDLDVVVVNTHYHWDHVGGNDGFADIAIHELGAEKLRRGPDPGRAEQLTYADAMEEGARFSPDGRSLLFVSNRERREDRRSSGSCRSTGRTAHDHRLPRRGLSRRMVT